MKARGTYTTDVAEIGHRVAVAGLTDVFAACSDTAKAIEHEQACAA